MRCQNAVRGIHRIVVPRCFNNKATKKVTVFYSKDRDESNSDMFYLCDQCYRNIKRDVKQRNLIIVSKKL